MMPAEPATSGNPVFSVHQTDIIVYGVDLEDYLRKEFDLPRREPPSNPPAAIPFWDVDRLQDARWSQGPWVFDNRRGVLPTSPPES